MPDDPVDAVLADVGAAGAELRACRQLVVVSEDDVPALSDPSIGSSRQDGVGGRAGL